MRSSGGSTTRLTSSRPGHAGAIEIVGAAGIGKTRLLAELADRADARGHIVLSGAAATSSATSRSGCSSTRSTSTSRASTRAWLSRL